MYDSRQLLVSLHIPKTAGTSLTEALRGWFGSDLALHYRGNHGERPEWIHPRAGLCVHGHFNRCRGIGALDFYPNARQFIVFLRNPFDRFVSQWRYLNFQKRSGVPVPDLDHDPSFAAWFDLRQQARERGGDPFSLLAQLPRPVHNPAEAAAVFDRDFLFVGLVERYQDSLDRLAQHLGRPAPAAVHVNRAGDPHRVGDPSADYAGFRRRHEQAFALEYEVYAAAERWGIAAPSGMKPRTHAVPGLPRPVLARWQGALHQMSAPKRV